MHESEQPLGAGNLCSPGITSPVSCLQIYANKGVIKMLSGCVQSVVI